MSSRKKRETKRKLRILRSRHKYLKTALSEIKEDLKRYESEWIHDFSYLTKKFVCSQQDKDDQSPKSSISFDDAIEKRLPPENKVDDFDVDKFKNSKSPEWAKSLYKKIARKTHPDALIKSENAEEMTSIFQEAAKSMSSGNHEKLFDIAFDLGINIGITDEETIARLNSSIKSLTSEIKDIEESFSWLWGESFGIIEIRLQIAQKALAQKKINADKEELSKIIKLLEERSDE